MNALLKQVGCDAMVAENVKCGTVAQEEINQYNVGEKVLCMGCQKTEILNEK